MTSDLKRVFRRFAPLLPVALLLLGALPDASARRTKVKFKTSEKVVSPASGEDLDLADLPSDSIAITLSGYDKPLNATRETLLVTNGYPFEIHGVTVEILYLDLDDRELHRRIVEISVEVPSKATRLVEIETFDRNKSYYYIKSKKPRVSAEPYKIRLRPLRVRR